MESRKNPRQLDEKGKIECIRRLTRNDLLVITNKSNRELLTLLNRTAFGFESFLKRRDYLIDEKTLDYELIELMVDAASRICTIRQQNALGAIERFLKTLGDCEKFVFCDALDVINDCLEEKKKVSLASYTKNYLIILRSMMKKDIGIQRIVDYILPSLQNSLNAMKMCKIPDLMVCQEEYEKLKSVVDRFEKPTPQIDEDDDDIGLFRELSILPQSNDIVNVVLPDLPCNKIDGPYNSVDQYLSVHFRLMREDMIRSMRDCIKMIENPNEAHKAGCCIYESVTVDFPPSYVPEGICYNIEIKTNIEMNLTKGSNLMSGNLVCLSPDNFHQTIYFATLVKSPQSSSNRTKQCKTQIRLEEILDDVLKTGVEYIMFEPNAYYECYKHILAAIKSFNKNNFPLSDFLVFFDCENAEPDYLVYPDLYKGKKYCLHEKCDESYQKPKSTDSKIMNGEESNKVINSKADTILPSNEELNNIYNESTCASGANTKKGAANNMNSDDCKVFNPLHSDEWPSAADLNLDEQQLAAFKTALTKKVAVIQGPPGTGKTFIGVKIVKTLLRNVPLTPIVICCLTNHALDQFLEHILKFTKKVVRLGHQSESNLIPPHVLENLAMACKMGCDTFSHKMATKDLKKSLNIMQILAPHLLEDVSSESDDKYMEMKAICNALNALFHDLKLCEKEYLNDSILNKMISSSCKEQLHAGSNTHSKILSSSILEWLCCSRTSELYEACNSRFLKLKNKKMKPYLYKDNVDLWHLKNLNERYELFYIWRDNFLSQLRSDIESKQEEFKKQKALLTEKIPDFLKVEILQSASVIGVTTTGAAKYRSLLRRINSAILIVEEAAQVLESHIIASLLPSTQHLILIGDHKQLRAIPANYELSEVYNLKISMFERLFDNLERLSSKVCATLTTQHRMKPCIADLLKQELLYKDLESAESVYKYEDIVGVNSSVFFINHCYAENEMSTSTSCTNEYEAETIASLAKYFCMQSYTEKQITILATYGAQVLLIQKYLAENRLEIKVTTVDNYQGEENEIMLISFVRSNMLGNIGFLKENNRVNVALSRAKKGMFCLGNFSLYAMKSELWKIIVGKLEKNDMIGEKIPLKCNQHSKLTLVDKSEEILKLVHRGCSEKCGFQLPCGHSCVRNCHYDDLDHFLYECPLPCEKYIDDNRKCRRKCSERCKNVKKLNITLECGHKARQRKDGSIISVCAEEIQKCLPCNHIDTLACGTKLSTYKCKALVSVVLPCGHKKNVFCHKKNDFGNIICYDLKPVVGPCGHIIDVPCSLNLEDDDLFVFCKSSCGILLNCGHTCKGYCYVCSDANIHALCTEKCDRFLNCGHKCSGYCGSPCPPCKEKCSLVCSHRTLCINLCYRPCVHCEENCSQGCEHVGKCDKKCFETCSVDICKQTCREILPCGHRCIGFCGDPCPYLCRVCNRNDLTSSDPDNDFFVELDDCNHVIEIGELEEHLENCIDCFIWPNCPVCNKPIRKSSRYKNILLKAKMSVLNSCDNSDEMDEVQYLFNSLFPEDKVIPSEFIDINEKIVTILNTSIKPSSSALYVLKQCIMSLRNLILINEKLRKGSNTLLESRFDTLLMWIYNHLTYASYQQLHELEKQVTELEKQLK